MKSSPRRPVVLEPLEEDRAVQLELAEELVDAAAALDVSVSQEQALLCVQHLLYVMQVNRYMNLTRITDLHEAVMLHLLDSLALTRCLPEKTASLLDMGTGAGFPGIPLAAVLGCKATLLDSVGKKIDAVNAFAQALGLDQVEGVHDRLESYAITQRGAFDLVVARAVGQLPMLMEYGTPLLASHGYLLLAKAHVSDDEFCAGEKAAALCGLECIARDEFELPSDLGHRTVLLYQRVHEPHVALPRAVGMAKRQPLA